MATTTTTAAAATTALFSVPSTPPHQVPVPKQIPYVNRWLFIGYTKSSFKLRPLVLRSSSTSSSSTPVVEQEEEGSLLVEAESTSVQESDSLSPLRGCKACGREEIEKGCNGEGRIQGGIATVPGFGWWPIKAYRPCPGFVASGGRYRRRGQSMDEVAWGRGERKDPMGTKNEA
ncbi:unnamed protein product [Ilex paraguariensis]|uniref:Uncharacterized protein n=1 Tax=Ilex paraguariensis TaxID=185542 RepID=A0ABC8RDU3_9AQUA